ncbi:hypothetical protein BH20ACT13_BH20ACT13_18890 [soil metagenome]
MLRFKARSADKGSMVSVVRGNPSRGDRQRERESGQALVEFALILPVFVVLVVGIIQFGVGLNYWLDMQRIANQGARWAVVNKFPTCSSAPDTLCTTPYTLQTYLQSEPVSGGLCPRVDITFPATTSEVGDPVKVLLWTPFTFVPILNLGTINLSADATMRLEQKPGRYQAGLSSSTC